MRSGIGFLVMVLFGGLNLNGQTTIQIQADQAVDDTILIYDPLNDQVVGTMVPKKGLNAITVVTDVPAVGVLKWRQQETDRRVPYLIPLGVDSLLQLELDSDTTFRTEAQSIHFLQYLHRSNNQFIAEHWSEIFGEGVLPEQVRSVWEKFRNERQAELDQIAPALSSAAQSFLSFQNDARIYSFLFYYGRNQNNLPVNSPFFQFTEAIDESPWTATLPNNLLYAYELAYVSKYDTIEQLHQFVQYIQEQTEGPDLADFLVSFYLQEVTLSPSYWRRHETLFNREDLEKVIREQADNRYLSRLQYTLEQLEKVGSGRKAYNFSARTAAGDTVRLTDYAGKVVYIDNWATWCGTCIQQKPDVLKVAESIDDPDLVVLMLSVDRSAARWERYIGDHPNEVRHVIEARVLDEELSAYTDQYSISFLPRYVLIDREGRIVDSNLKAASTAVAEKIRKVLAK